jgi:adenosine deaminase
MDPAEGLMEFIAKFKYLTAVMVDTDVCRRIAWENVLDAAAEGIDYIELRFSPWFMADTHGLNAGDVTAAVIDGIQAGVAATGVRAQAIGILSRTYGPDIGLQELDALLAHRDGLVAVDLAGDEKRFPASLFKEHFKKVCDAGLHTTIHAGEADGPHSVWRPGCRAHRSRHTFHRGSGFGRLSGQTADWFGGLPQFQSAYQ